MNRNKWISVIVGAALIVPLVTNPQTPSAVGKNFESLLERILANQQQMQTDIQQLKDRLEQKDREIASLRETLDKHNAAIGERVKAEVDRRAQTLQERTTQNSAKSTDAYSARLQYDSARELMHEAIFEVRKGEQGPWFRRVVEEFRKVTEGYPHTAEAAEARLRIARIYRRYLGDVEKAKIEYQALLDNYSDSKHAEEARKALEDLKDVR